jgi:transcriptional antiterminator RfaH
VIPPSPNPAWFCIRSKPKREHLAAAQLVEQAKIEIFVPRIRFRRSTRRGAAWVTEALFPSYFFARFDLGLQSRRIQSARDVTKIVHFGNHWPVVPDHAISQLRLIIGTDDVRVIEPELKSGDDVEIAGGAFHGLQAVVTRVVPGSQRIAVLLDFLGRQTMVDLDRTHLVPKRGLY